MTRQYLLTDGELQALLSVAMQFAHKEKTLLQCMVWIEAALACLAVHGPILHSGDVAKVVSILGTKQSTPVQRAG